MATNYDEIAEEYQASKLQPWRQFIESYTLFNTLGDVTNKSVLDLACGEGFYSRQLKLRGAAIVEGVDVSEGMIQLARNSEASKPLDINYHIHDVKHLELDKQFDIVTASYLMNYAQTYNELKRFADVIKKHLKPGGRFVTINSNPSYDAPVDSTLKYGFTRENKGPKEGDDVVYRIYESNGNFFDIINYHLNKTTHVRAFQDAGFINIQWHKMLLNPEVESHFEPDYWKAFLLTQPVTGFSCNRP